MSVPSDSDAAPHTTATNFPSPAIEGFAFDRPLTPRDAVASVPRAGLDADSTAAATTTKAIRKAVEIDWTPERTDITFFRNEAVNPIATTLGHRRP
jgi:hypothetical protein